MVVKDGFTFFWGIKDFLSNWYPASFTEKNNIFYNTEQYFMYYKALTFEDKIRAAAILKTPHPKEVKALGRQVTNFSSAVWNNVSENIMLKGNRQKYIQNHFLMLDLINTKGTILVEASPYDRIWGIGLSSDDPRASNPSQWLGYNKLGNILTSVREEFS